MTPFAEKELRQAIKTVERDFLVTSAMWDGQTYKGAMLNDADAVYRLLCFARETILINSQSKESTRLREAIIWTKKYIEFMDGHWALDLLIKVAEKELQNKEPA